MALQPGSGVANQPWNRVIWPKADRTIDAVWPSFGVGPFVYDATTALRIPAVSRATMLYSGLIKTCALDAFRGVEPLARPRLLDAPDPEQTRSWFVGVQIEDYLWHGNAISLVTARSAEGWPLAVAWVPASWVTIVWQPGDARHRYMVGNTELPFDNVNHVRRGSDRRLPARGVGVIEQHLATFDRAALEEDYERGSLAGSGVPSVAVITPNPSLSQEEADDGKTVWMDKFAGPNREPAILPFGTTVIPLGWSPADSQMIEARKMSLLDVANCFNLDGYWLGAPASAMTYRSPGPLYLGLLRTSLEPVMTDFELGWGASWLPRGQTIRFDRLQLTRDDFLTSLGALTTATAAEGPVLSVAEAREYLGFGRSGESSAVAVASPVDTTEVAPVIATPSEIVLFETSITPADKTGTVTRLAGRAVPYGVWTNRGWFMESVAAGSLDKSIAEAASGLPLLLFHDGDRFPVGVSEEWDSRKDALYGVWRLDQGAEAQRAGQLARDGLLRWFSVGIVPIRSEWETVPPESWNPDLGPAYMDKLTRVEARLAETSLVTVPAFPTAEVLSVYGAKMRQTLERTDVPRRPHAERAPHLRSWRDWRATLG